MKMVRLGNLSDSEEAFADGPFGSNLKTEHYRPSGARVVRLQNIGKGEFLDKDKAFIAFDHYEKLLRHRVEPGDIVVAALGNGARPAGRACLIPENFGPGIVKADCFRMRLPQTGVHAPYVVWAMNSPALLNQVSESMRGATRPRVTLALLKNLVLPLPSVREQKRIAAILNEQMRRVNEARSAVESLKRDIGALRVATLREEARKLREKQVATKLFGEFVASYRNGFGRRPHGVEQGPVVLRIADVSSGRIELSSPRRVQADPDEIKTYGVQRRDLLFIRVNGSSEIVGRCIVAEDVPETILFNDHLIRVRLVEGIEPRFVQFAMNLPENRELLGTLASTSAGQLTINQEALSAIPVPLLSVAEQRSLISELEARLQEIASLEAGASESVATLESVPPALLRRAFAGAP